MMEANRPIDMAVVIDNSGSMYGPNGNDPDLLRIIGAHIFIARLGFGEPNENDYQASVISMGGVPELIAPLQPLTRPVRGSLARTTSDPEDAGGTHIIHALEMAYQELRTSPNRKPGSLPAVVLLTDGVPDPPAGQSQADIEQLVSENPDIPLFVMLLQNRVGGSSPEYQAYITFWRQLQTRHTHLFTYQVEDAEQIENIYNQIIAQLHSTVPSERFLVVPGKPVDVFVSRYVQRLIVTIVHERDMERGEVIIKDSVGIEVLDTDQDVSRFDDPDNLAEVVSIGPRRIGTLVDDVWTIETDVPVYIFLDRQGAYRFNFEAPEVGLTDVTNVYLAIDRHSPSRELVIRFTLLNNKDDSVITDPQPIYGMVIHPDGSEAELRIPVVHPDGRGVYQIEYDYSSYPQALTESGRYAFTLKAGQANDQEGERIPVTIAKLLVDVGRGVYIQAVEPSPLICQAGQSAPVTVTLGDSDTADMNTAHLRIFGGGADVELARSGEDAFSGDVSALCASLLSGATCSTTVDTTFRTRLVAQSPDGSTLPPSERVVAVQALAPTCTPTPTPTATPAPPPPPTPIPDSDGDGWDDLVDQCKDQPGIAMFNGCPPPIWFWVLIGALGLGLLAFLVLWLIPWINVRINPPPEAFVLVCRAGERRAVPISIRQVGLNRRKNKVTIGGDQKKAHIYVKDLKPIEFVVEKQGEQAVLLDAETGFRKGTFSDKAQSSISTSNTGIALRISLDRSKLRC
jgi:hypothetical protein